MRNMQKVTVLAVAILIVLFMAACTGGSGSNKCTICKKAATHTFQGSGYCNSHYADAVAWARTHRK